MAGLDGAEYTHYRHGWRGFVALIDDAFLRTLSEKRRVWYALSA